MKPEPVQNTTSIGDVPVDGTDYIQGASLVKGPEGLALDGGTGQSFFPAGHSLHALKKPDYQSLLASLATYDVSCIFNTSKYDSAREGVRPCFADLHGPGSELMIHLSACYLSSPGKNAVYFADEYHKPLPDGKVRVYPSIDRTAVQYMQEIGFLGSSETDALFIKDLVDLRSIASARQRRVYSMDSYGPDADPISANSDAAFTLCNSKEWVNDLTTFGPEEYRTSVFEANDRFYREVSFGGRREVYLKSCNTEAASDGVIRVTNLAEFEESISILQSRTKSFGLNPTVIAQPEIEGQNKSFQIFVDPASPDEILVLAMTDQIVGDDKVTYRGNVNHAITPERLEVVGPAIVDLVRGIRRQQPEVFGFVMCDYFEAADGKVTLFDPGLRPTGNTPSVMVKLWFESQNPQVDITVHNFVYVNHPEDSLPFSTVRQRLGSLADPEHILSTGFGVLPWGHNHVAGKSMFILIAPTDADYDAFRDEVFKRLY